MSPRMPKLGFQVIQSRHDSEKDLDLIIIHGENAWPWQDSRDGQTYPYPFITNQKLDVRSFFWPSWLCEERGFERVALSLFCYSNVSSAELHDHENLDYWVDGTAENLLH